MISWDPWHSYEPDRTVREQDELARQDWERRLMYGTHVPVGRGFSLPEWEECPRHRYIAVDGLCGVCLLERKQLEERKAA